MPQPMGVHTARVLALFRAWAGPPLGYRDVAALTGLEPDKGLHNALDYLARRRRFLERVADGVYRRRQGPDGPDLFA